jgi:hypothetical protein
LADPASAAHAAQSYLKDNVQKHAVVSARLIKRGQTETAVLLDPRTGKKNGVCHGENAQKRHDKRLFLRKLSRM